MSTNLFCDLSFLTVSRQRPTFLPSGDMVNVTFRSYLLLLSTLLLVAVSSWSRNTEDERGTSTPSIYVAHYIDPDIIDSEWNHHVAGYALIASAVLYVIGLLIPRMKWARSSWIMLLVAAAMFLAVWSDKEIWPRGTLTWMWLIHHDAEARQHKIYALLLLVIGLVEYFRQSGRLSRLWCTWAFPTLAFLGACLLLMHTHDGHSGLAAGWDDAEKRTKILKMVGFGAMPMPMDVTGTDVAPEHHVYAARIPQESQPMPMPQSQTGGAKSIQTGHSDSEHHHHVTIVATTHVQQQHLWFAVVGITLALFKWVDDGQFWRSKLTTYLWPCSMLTLGVLLALYTEVQ